MAGRRLAGGAGVLGVVVLCAALLSTPAGAAKPPPGFAESLCPRAQAPDPDCYTIALPAEIWAVATTLRIKPTRRARRAYDRLIPKPFFPIPGRRRVAVLMFRLNTQMSPDRGAGTDPGPGYAEGSVAIRVGFPAREGYPYRVGWWNLAQPLNDPSQYNAGRDIGLPKYMARAGLRITDGRWRAYATRWGRARSGPPGLRTVRRGNTLRIGWSDKRPRVGRRRARLLRRWGRYGEPLFVQNRPHDEARPHEPGLVKFTPASFVPVQGAPDSPLTIPPEPRMGTARVTLRGRTPGGMPFARLIGRRPRVTAGTSAFTRGYAFITADRLRNNQAGGGGPEGPRGQRLPGCAGPASGGEWRAYGHDLRNTRAQPEERRINAGNVAGLEPSFVFDTTKHGAGVVHSTPVIADGCVYFGTGAPPPRGEPDPAVAAASGWVYALNAQTGKLAWRRKLKVGKPGLLCTGVVGSTPVAGGRLFAIVSQAGSPYAVALSQRTGKVLWKRVIDRTPGVYDCGSPVVFRGIVVAPFTGDQTGAANRGGYALFDARTGRLLAKRYTIPQRAYAKGYKGGGIWSTAAVDRAGRFAYVGTANPDAGSPEHPRTNSILKIDLDRRRRTFGQIVSSYKGNPDRYAENFPGGSLPCDPDHRLSPYIRSVLCAQLDLDFGASPTLYQGPGGRLRAGALQKSGVFHAVDARSMKGVWRTVVSPPVFYGNSATAATDGRSIFVASSPPGHMVGLDATAGAPLWTMPLGDLIHYQGVSYANGLVYVNDAKGQLSVFRADNGILAAQRSIAADVGQPAFAEESSGSTAIARNTVYVGAANYLVAYRLP